MKKISAIRSVSMGVLDKFLDVMKLSDDEDYEDDFFDEEEDYEDDYDEDYEDEKPKKSFFKKEKKHNKGKDDYEVEYDEEGSESKSKSRNNVTNNNKVTPMRGHGKKDSMEVCVIKPTNVDDTREITETLLGGSTIILNLEGLDLEVAQRVIDFTSGATFAIDGKLQKISNYIFLVTPTNVDISGDLQDLLNTSFDVPSIKTKY